MLNEQNQDIELKKVTEFVLKNKFKFIINSSIAILVSIIITLFIPNEYRSFGIIYPPSNNSLENSVENPSFGYDLEADRIIQILQSQSIKDSVTTKFNLYTYFEIDTTELDARDQLAKQFSKAIAFERTNYMSVAISARTKNPELSANIVNYIIDKVNELREKIYKQNLMLANSIAQIEFEQQKHASDSLLAIVKTDLDKLNLSGLLVLATNAQLNFNELNIKQASIENSNVGVNIINYRSQLERQREMEAKLFKLKKVYDNPIPKVYVIDRGMPSHKKVYPSFLVNAVIASIIALIATLFFILAKSKK
jgi:capsular polysaccharide biosynthesis protein